MLLSFAFVRNFPNKKAHLYLLGLLMSAYACAYALVKTSFFGYPTRSWLGEGGLGGGGEEE